jgi:hypothetical protein
MSISLAFVVPFLDSLNYDNKKGQEKSFIKSSLFKFRFNSKQFVPAQQTVSLTLSNWTGFISWSRPLFQIGRRRPCLLVPLQLKLPSTTFLVPPYLPSFQFHQTSLEVTAGDLPFTLAWVTSGDPSLSDLVGGHSRWPPLTPFFESCWSHIRWLLIQSRGWRSQLVTSSSPNLASGSWDPSNPFNFASGSWDPSNPFQSCFRVLGPFKSLPILLQGLGTLQIPSNSSNPFIFYLNLSWWASLKGGRL